MDMPWRTNDFALNKLDEGEPFVCMFSGGKDCGLALHIASEVGKCVALVHCVQEDTRNSIFHRQSASFAAAQAEAMGYPLITLPVSPWHGTASFVGILKDLAAQGVCSMVFGDIHVRENAALQRGLSLQAKLLPRMPLWNMPWEELLALYQAYHLQSVITAVNLRHVFCPELLLGKHFDKDTCEMMIHNNADPFGEYGEYHTTLINGSLFKKPLNYTAETIVTEPFHQYLVCRCTNYSTAAQ